MKTIIKVGVYVLMARLDTPTYSHRPHLASRIFSGFI